MTNIFTDPRDNQTYKTVEINGKIWLAENLRYKGLDYKIPNGNENNITKYGCLYDWKNTYQAIPTGWHIPSKEEFEALSGDLSDSNTHLYCQFAGLFDRSDKYADFEKRLWLWSDTPWGAYGRFVLLVTKDNFSVLSMASKKCYCSIRCIKD